MSEEVNTSATASEPAQPASSSPPKKDKKKLWLMIVAVIVAILLISTAVYVLVINKPGEEDIGLDLESEILPSDDLTMDALEMVEFSVTSMLVNDTEDISHEIDDWTNVTYSWSRTPYELGSFNLLARRTVEFTATNVSMSGTVTCTVEWEDESVQVSADLYINPPYLDSVLVSPDEWQLAPEEPHVFTASALNSVGDIMTGITFMWTVTGMDSADYTLSSAVGESVTFTGLVEGNATLNATATSGGITKAGGAVIQVGGAPMRTVDYLYYDLFNVPFGEWWDWRWTYYGTEEVVTREYPYIFKWYGNDTNVWLYANQRLNVTGRNMPEINMNERPEFLPLLGEARGGTAKIDWYMQYLTAEDMERYPDNTAAWLDGWVIALNGTVTLDRTAAMAVMGITSEGFDDFDTWWTANDDIFINDYIDWILYEGNDRLDIFCAYEYPLTPLSFNIDAEKVGDEIVLTYDTVTWGMEAMMFRWLKEAFMPVEWYYEDMYFRATIGPQYMDIDVDTAIVYAAYAYETTLDQAPCWMWEALMQDYVGSSGAHPYSLYDVYEGLEYVNYAPGSPWYGTYMPYDYAPGAHNLSENESMVLEWPGEDYLLFYTHDEPYKTFNWTGAMTCNYSEPDWVEFPGQVVLDKDARTLSFEGPIDFWTWSKLQADLYLTGDTRYDNLGSEWNRLDGVLPYGCPTIEFRLASDEDPVPYTLRVDGITNPIEEDTLSGVTVTVLDQLGTVYTTYTGTVEFSSDDTGATLPAQYTFQAADLGTKTFPDSVMFSTAGTYYVMAEDVSDPALFGSQENIEVYSSSVATSLLVEGATSPIMEGVASGFTVTVLDQLGLPYTGSYEGTIEFSSNDTAAVLPANYQFTLLDAGTHTWDAADGVTFNTAGVHDLTAFDIGTPAISGSQLGIVVTEAPMMDSFEVVLSADTAIANDTMLDVTVTALDQFGDPYPDYVGTVVFSSDDSVALLPTASLDFTAIDLGVRTWTGEIMMGTPGLRTITVEDSVDAAITGSDQVTVTAERAATYFVITDMAPTVQIDVAEAFTVTVYDQYDDVFLPYDGIATFSTNRSGDVTLPSDYDFSPADLGTHDFSVTFTVEGFFTVTVSDLDDPTISGEVTMIRVTSTAPELDHFVVEGITDPMWEDNYSDVIVTAYNQFNDVFTSYVGTIEFSTDALVDTYTLPADYMFQVADDGTKTFPLGVMFEEGGVYYVAATDNVGGETGSQTGIDIVELDPTTLEITGAPSAVVAPGETFSLTVSVYHQFNELCYEYDGTVEFTTSDADAGVVMPSPYTFTETDAGTHDFTGEFALVTPGDQTITAEDQGDATLTDEVTVTVEAPPQRTVDYKVYDFLAEPFGEWWQPRWDAYTSDVVVSMGTNANAALYYIEGADSGADADTQGIIYAPYRYNITAKNLTTVGVHSPEFLPMYNSAPQAGAEATMNVYYQYMYEDWFVNVLYPDWTGTLGFPGSQYWRQQDGYITTTIYTVTMNRAAAYEWINLPTSEANPEAWYALQQAAMNTWYADWFLYEGDTRLDIAFGYEDNYYSEQTSSRISYDSGTGEVTLEIAHFSWGYEVLLTRWLTEIGVSPNHEPWYEDFNMDVYYGEEYTDLWMDAVCQYSLHAVKSNGTADGAAWAWEPAHIDYIVESELPTWYAGTPDLPSEYEPYFPLTYQSWNAGDNLFEDEVTYEYTPYWFNLTEGETLAFEMPATSVLGYQGVGMDYTDYQAAEVEWSDYISAGAGDLTVFDAIETTGAVSLGHYVTGGADLGSMVSGSTLTIEGPVSFDNVRHSPDGPLYHGAPWIEFDVGATKLAALDAGTSAEASTPATSASVAPASAGSASGALSMMAVVCATMVAVAALGAGRKVSV